MFQIQVINPLLGHIVTDLQLIFRIVPSNSHETYGDCFLTYVWCLGNGMGKPAGIAPATRTRTHRTILPKNPWVTCQNEPKNIKIRQVLREIYSKWLSLFILTIHQQKWEKQGCMGEISQGRSAFTWITREYPTISGFV